MQKIKKIWVFVIFFIIINLSLSIYADDEIEEVDITIEEMEEILEASSGITDTPNINSRNAVIYDRTSRRNSIWETRKQKM